MAAGRTYTPIARTTLTGTATDVTFSSISGTYTDLIVISSAKMSGSGQDLKIQFNSDTGSNYSWTYLSGDGSSTYSARATAQSYITGDAYGYMNTSNNNIAIHHIMNYSNTTTHKTVLSRSSNGSTGVDAIVGLWRSTSAINSIKLSPTGGQSFASGSTFTLYGIAAA